MKWIIKSKKTWILSMIIILMILGIVVKVSIRLNSKNPETDTNTALTQSFEATTPIPSITPLPTSTITVETIIASTITQEPDENPIVTIAPDPADIPINGLTQTPIKSPIPLQNHFEEDEFITWQDKGFEEGVRILLNKPEGYIYKNEVYDMKELIIQSQNIKVIDDIENFPNLNKLVLGLDTETDDDSQFYRLNQIKDIQLLSTLSKLTYLDLNNNIVNDISPLGALTELTFLDLSVNNISNISALCNLEHLKYLNLNINNVTDFSALEDLSNLETLYLKMNNIIDISLLANLTNLKQLSLFRNNISDISPLANLTNLKELDLSNNKISDISALSNMEELDFLILEYNEISDISALSNLNKLETLWIGFNLITDWSPVKDRFPDIDR